MTWQEKVGQLEKDGKFAEASRVFAFSLPNASYAQKMQFADRMYKSGAFRKARQWYEECIGTPVEDEYYYLTDVGGCGKRLARKRKSENRKGGYHVRIEKI